MKSRVVEEGASKFCKQGVPSAAVSCQRADSGVAKAKSVTDTVAEIRKLLSHAVAAQKDVEAALAKRRPGPGSDPRDLTSRVQQLSHHVMLTFDAASGLESGLSSLAADEGASSSLADLPLLRRSTASAAPKAGTPRWNGSAGHSQPPQPGCDLRRSCTAIPGLKRAPELPGTPRTAWKPAGPPCSVRSSWDGAQSERNSIQRFGPFSTRSDAPQISSMLQPQHSHDSALPAKPSIPISRASSAAGNHPAGVTIAVRSAAPNLVWNSKLLPPQRYAPAAAVMVNTSMQTEAMFTSSTQTEATFTSSVQIEATVSSSAQTEAMITSSMQTETAFDSEDSEPVLSLRRQLELSLKTTEDRTWEIRALHAELGKMIADGEETAALAQRQELEISNLSSQLKESETLREVSRQVHGAELDRHLSMILELRNALLGHRSQSAAVAAAAVAANGFSAQLEDAMYKQAALRTQHEAVVNELLSAPCLPSAADRRVDHPSVSPRLSHLAAGKGATEARDVRVIDVLTFEDKRKDSPPASALASPAELSPGHSVTGRYVETRHSSERQCLDAEDYCSMASPQEVGSTGSDCDRCLGPRHSGLSFENVDLQQAGEDAGATPNSVALLAEMAAAGFEIQAVARLKASSSGVPGQH